MAICTGENPSEVEFSYTIRSALSGRKLMDKTLDAQAVCTFRSYSISVKCSSLTEYDMMEV